MRARPGLILNLAAFAALGFALTASDCSHTFSFTPPVGAEICDDGIDNDSNGVADCRDPACFGAAVCLPSVTIDPLPALVLAESLQVAGNFLRAALVQVSVSPTSQTGSAALGGGGRWTFMLRNLQNGLNTLTAVASDSTGRFRDTATASFTVQRQ